MTAKCKSMPEEIAPLARFLREVTKETRHEMAVTICRDGREAYPETVCVGICDKVPMERIAPCQRGREFGLMHTHLGIDSPAPSAADLLYTLIGEEETMCVIPRSGNMSCFFNIDALKDVFDRNEPIDEYLSRRYDEARKKAFHEYQRNKSWHFEDMDNRYGELVLQMLDDLGIKRCEVEL